MASTKFSGVVIRHIVKYLMCIRPGNFGETFCKYSAGINVSCDMSCEAFVFLLLYATCTPALPVLFIFFLWLLFFRTLKNEIAYNFIFSAMLNAPIGRNVQTCYEKRPITHTCKLYFESLYQGCRGIDYALFKSIA